MIIAFAWPHPLSTTVHENYFEFVCLFLSVPYIGEIRNWWYYSSSQFSINCILCWPVYTYWMWAFLCCIDVQMFLAWTVNYRKWGCSVISALLISMGVTDFCDFHSDVKDCVFVEIKTHEAWGEMKSVLFCFFQRKNIEFSRPIAAIVQQAGWWKQIC